MELLLSPWPWYIAGPLLSIVMFLMIYAGKNFGMSSNLRTMCSIGGAGKYASFFDFNWKSQIWNLMFVVGTILGGFVAANFLTSPDQTGIEISQNTAAKLESYGIESFQDQIIPTELFSGTDLKSIVILIVAGLLIGFGARYAGGCTSGHAISGLSNLQWPSLIAVIGFFIGGLLMTHIILPLIL